MNIHDYFSNFRKPSVVENLNCCALFLQRLKKKKKKHEKKKKKIKTTCFLNVDFAELHEFLNYTLGFYFFYFNPPNYPNYV